MLFYVHKQVRIFWTQFLCQELRIKYKYICMYCWKFCFRFWKYQESAFCFIVLLGPIRNKIWFILTIITAGSHNIWSGPTSDSMCWTKLYSRKTPEKKTSCNTSKSSMYLKLSWGRVNVSIVIALSDYSIPPSRGMNWVMVWSGVQKAGTAGTGGIRQTTCGWTKWDLIIGHIMKSTKMFCLTLD